MKKVFASNDPTRIQILRDMLAHEGIETTVLNESTSAVLGEIPFFSAMPEVWILHDDDGPRARAIVERFESGEVRDAARKPPWTCPQCGQQIEGQFTECWSCDANDPRHDREARCHECGYRLWGLPERRCPECGTEF